MTLAVYKRLILFFIELLVLVLAGVHKLISMTIALLLQKCLTLKGIMGRKIFGSHWFSLHPFILLFQFLVI